MRNPQNLLCHLALQRILLTCHILRNSFALYLTVVCVAIIHFLDLTLLELPSSTLTPKLTLLTPHFVLRRLFS